MRPLITRLGDIVALYFIILVALSQQPFYFFTLFQNTTQYTMHYLTLIVLHILQIHRRRWNVSKQSSLCPSSLAGGAGAILCRFHPCFLTALIFLEILDLHACFTGTFRLKLFKCQWVFLTEESILIILVSEAKFTGALPVHAFHAAACPQ